MQGYYLMASACDSGFMQKPLKKPGELTHPMHLEMIFHQKQLNATKLD